MKFDEYYISDLVEVTSSKRVYAKDYSSCGIPFYRSKEIILLSKGYNIKDSLYITKEKYENIEKNSMPKDGDILLTSVGTIGVPLLILKSHLPFYFKDGNLIRFHNFKSLLINKYLFYWLKSPIGKHEINKITIGSTQKALTMVQIKKIPIKVPNISYQNKIVSILSSLDSKIELNNQIISNLEELASTLFKRWFVDFEFPDKNGNPYKSSGGKMIDSELGEIPESFSVENFGSHIKYISKGTTPTKKDLLSSKSIKNVKYLKVKDIPSVGMINYKNLEEIPEDVHEKQLKRSALKKGDIILSIAGTIGRVNIISSETELNTNQAVSFIRLNEERFQYYYLQLLKSKYYQQILQKKIVQAVQANLSLSEIKKMKIVVPPKEVISSFTIVIDNLYSNIISTDREKNNLEELRDLLLPKLLSGEIELPEDEEV
ncbi:TPA: restriction endonuclease subunit S [Enterococcus hirae]